VAQEGAGSEKFLSKKTRISGIAMQGPRSGPAALSAMRVLADRTCGR
jgi:hypothetical protein